MPAIDIAQRPHLAQRLARLFARRRPEPAQGAKRPRVVVVGAGFGGLSVAKKLGNSDVDVLLLDRNNYQGFWPLLYQVATAGLEAESIASPVRRVVRRYKNVDFKMTEVQGVDLDRKLVLADDQAIPYDYLVLAAGSAHNYFGNEALATHTFGIKDIPEAERLRNHVLEAFELAASETDPARRAALMTVVVVGGGPTGVELAGAFAELIRQVLKKDYPKLDTGQARVLLVEGNAHLLGGFPESLQRSAEKRLVQMGVEVRLETGVSAVDEEAVTFKDGSQERAHTVVWAAGVRAAPLVDALNVTLGRGARIKVELTLNLAGRPEVFAIGDIAYLEGYHKHEPYPMVAPVAIQEGWRAAHNILLHVRGEAMRPFRYIDQGKMAPIGRNSAVLQTAGLSFRGITAWLIWLSVYLGVLNGARNRLVVLANWGYSYLTHDRGVRLITRKDSRR